MIRKDLIVAVVLAFCLSVTLFRILPISSQGPGDYDPWYDINDDGKIDMKDIGGVARKFGTSGTAINKTELLLNLTSRVEILEARAGIVVYNDIGNFYDVPPTAANLGSVTLNVPTSGYVLITVTAFVYLSGDGTMCYLGLGTLPGADNLARTASGYSEGTGGLTRTESLACQAVVPVTSGSHTFYATGYKVVWAAYQEANLWNIYLTALFCGT